MAVNDPRTQALLIVDDDAQMRDLLVDTLGSDYYIYTAETGEEALELARRYNPAAVILDLVMPGIDGIQVIQKLRDNRNTKDIPVIMLSGLDDVNKRVQAFMGGADDFIQKPFHRAELLARVHSKMRRLQAVPSPEAQPEDPELIRCGNLTLDRRRLEARIDNRPISTSVLEFNLLTYLVRNRDRVLDRKQILAEIWAGTVVSSRTVDTHVAILRKKLAGSRYSISTVYGAGYIFKKS